MKVDGVVAEAEAEAEGVEVIDIIVKIGMVIEIIEEVIIVGMIDGAIVIVVVIIEDIKLVVFFVNHIR